MIKGEIFFAEAPLDFIHFFAVASKLAVQHKNESSPMDCFFVFGTMCSARRIVMLRTACVMLPSTALYFCYRKK